MRSMNDGCSNSQFITQRGRINANLYLPPTDLFVRFFGRFNSLSHDVLVFRAGEDCNFGFEKCEEALYDDALEELDITALVYGKLNDCGTRSIEQVLKMLLASVQELQARSVRECRLRTEWGRGVRLVRVKARVRRAHLLRGLCAFAPLFVLRVDSLLFLLDESRLGASRMSEA